MDNDGDIDFVINGLNEDDQWRKYIYLSEENALIEATDYNNQFNNEQGYIEGVVKIADNDLDGDLDIFMLGENDSRVQTNTYINDENANGGWFNPWLANLESSAMTQFGNYIYYMGEDSNDQQMKFYSRQLDWEDNQQMMNIEGLKNGDIAIGDYNNDGFEDMVVTGENINAESVTKLYNGNGFGGFIENTDVDLVGLRNSTAKWVDYDNDGDLDLFLTELMMKESFHFFTELIY